MVATLASDTGVCGTVACHWASPLVAAPRRQELQDLRHECRNGVGGDAANSVKTKMVQITSMIDHLPDLHNAPEIYVDMKFGHFLIHDPYGY